MRRPTTVRALDVATKNGRPQKIWSRFGLGHYTSFQRFPFGLVRACSIAGTANTEEPASSLVADTQWRVIASESDLVR